MQLQSNKSLNTKGYTLVEILIVLVVMTILFGSGYAMYRNFSRRQELLGAAKEVQSDLRQAQQMAISGIKPDACGDNTLNGIYFKSTYDSTKSQYVYRIRAVCGCSGSSCPLIKENYLPSSLTLASSSSSEVVFKVLGQGTNISSGSVVYTITQTSTGDTSTVTIDSGGTIK